MDGSGIGSGSNAEASPSTWTASKEGYGGANNTSSPTTSPTACRKTEAKSLRSGSLFTTSYTRSVSLPHALQTLTLSGRSMHQKGPDKASQEHSNFSLQPEVPRTSRVDNNFGADDKNLPHQPSYCPSTLDGGNPSISRPIPSGSKSMEANGQVPHPSGTSSSPSSSSALNHSLQKRAISEGNATSQFTKTGPWLIGRSETNPSLADTLYGGKSQLLDPLPHGDSRGAKGRHIRQPSELSEFAEEFAASIDSALPQNSDSFASQTKRGASYFNTELLDEPQPPLLATERALSRPDILRHILNALDAMTVIPHELVQQRRKPLSLRHAQLIFGDTKKAVEAWERSQPTTTADCPGAGLFNCLLVNSMWNEVASSVLEDRIHFRTNERWTQFARRGAAKLSRKPRMLVLHKLSEATQVELDLIDNHQLGENLEWLEFYTCAGLAPPSSLLGAQLTRIILPGCYRVQDRTLALIASKCPRLEHLDVRACEQVSDRGIKMIAKYCPQLQLLNVGRTRGGELVTYKGIKHLARQTQLTTLGIAGCNIDDRAIWELALNRGPKLQRLSLNNCKLLTDASVPRVLGYMPNLTVLEIRGCMQITHMRPIALFKAYREKQDQPPLIEGCEVIERRLQVAMMRLQRETSQRILQDLLQWVNDDAE